MQWKLRLVPYLKWSSSHDFLQSIVKMSDHSAIVGLKWNEVGWDLISKGRTLTRIKKFTGNAKVLLKRWLTLPFTVWRSQEPFFAWSVTDDEAPAFAITPILENMMDLPYMFSTKKTTTHTYKIKVVIIRLSDFFHISLQSVKNVNTAMKNISCARTANFLQCNNMKCTLNDMA